MTSHLLDWSNTPQWQMSISVTTQHIDALGHVNNQVYLDWMLQAANRHAQAVGLDFATQQKMGKVMVAREHQMTFLKSCFKQDQLVIGTWVGERLGCCQRLRHYEIFRLSDQQKVFSGQTAWACMQLKHYKPCRLPTEFITAYQR